MAKKKIKRFAETATFPNFIQVPYAELSRPFPLKGKWSSEFFKNDNPLYLELGCGKGEYTIGLAKKYPDRNYIGVDIKGARMWRGAKTGIEENINNAGFLRTQIGLIQNYFEKEEINGLWITFPDPFLKKAKANKRLTSPRFLRFYREILASDAKIHLKTDNAQLFDYTLETIEELDHNLIYATRDLYLDQPLGEAAAIQTFYEKMWLSLGLKIHYLTFKLKNAAF